MGLVQPFHYFPQCGDLDAQFPAHVTLGWWCWRQHDCVEDLRFEFLVSLNLNYPEIFLPVIEGVRPNMSYANIGARIHNHPVHVDTPLATIGHRVPPATLSYDTPVVAGHQVNVIGIYERRISAVQLDYHHTVTHRIHHRSVLPDFFECACPAPASRSRAT